MVQTGDHGVGSWGVRITYKRGNRQVTLWSLTEKEREADFKMHQDKPEVKTITRVRR